MMVEQNDRHEKSSVKTYNKRRLNRSMRRAAKKDPEDAPRRKSASPGSVEEREMKKPKDKAMHRVFQVPLKIDFRAVGSISDRELREIIGSALPRTSSPNSAGC